MVIIIVLLLKTYKHRVFSIRDEFVPSICILLIVIMLPIKFGVIYI